MHTIRCGPATLVSVHPTSQGIVEYRRCRCGRLIVRRDGRTILPAR